MNKLMRMFLLALVLLAIAVYLRWVSASYVLGLAEALVRRVVSLLAGAR